MPFPPLVEPTDTLSDAERVRTARHAALAGFGELSQRRLAASRVAVIGAGGLGSPVVLALAAAGVGELVVIDDDVVDQSNLHRQILHRHADLGAPKVDSAVRAAADLSPTTTVRAVRRRLTADNAAELLAGAHLVIDGSDTFETRGAVAAATEASGIPLVWGTLQEFDAQVTVFWSSPPPGHDAVVLHDLYPPESVGEVPTCAQVGVLGALCVQVGGLLAIEAIKLLTGIGEPLLGRVLLIDSLRARQREIPLRSSRTPAPATDAAFPSGKTGLMGETGLSGEADSASPARVPDAPVPVHVSPTLLDDSRAAGATVLDVREPRETATGTIEGARLVPLGEVLADPSALGTGPFVVVCQAGVRAERAAVALLRAGASASVLSGGMDAWQGTGHRATA
ncbi:ThiF family adenylyltransferase [Microbacterium sp. cx-55]|uniref:ThiF family adenylyltransferase n=1 Tax=Microbacterium sp. cx-55 TaxID=2875948 RepID=UPI001CBD6D16|nr:ThiF family adenylyltransferase [Microbacterium sp. cx-55]MBZ4487958.1 ThiF family adenylyltransferase [Microbacterium sp. cx-55]UGB34632.1 ThiF family adenylyltransferase [Microbacterium sp. cx-55]